MVANIACYLASRRGRRVVAIDMDPQGQLGKVLGLASRSASRSAVELLVNSVLGEPAATAAPPPPPGLPRMRTRFPNLDVIVANKSLALFPSWTGATESDPTGCLAARLDAAGELEETDFVLIDGPPSFGPLTLNVLRAVDEVVIPVPLTYLALDGCAELTRTIETVREREGHPTLHVALVIPTFYRRTRLAHEVLDRLKQRFPKELAHTVVGLHVKLDEAQSHGLSIFEYAPSDRGARAMAALAEELEAREPAPPTEGAPQ
ncbi:MAG: ParA family protein [Proteobacteria bacterium]|nr:ParA family protein [Pseudomonadota bacterium]